MNVVLASILAGLGVFLWFWGAFHLSGKKSYLWKIHALGAADTIGTLLILAGVLLYSTENWPHILLAMSAVAFWGTALSFILGRLGRRSEGGERDE